jgi:RND superfamily putative drug exporter
LAPTARRPWLILAVWIAIAVGGLLQSGTVFSLLRDAPSSSLTEAARTTHLLSTRTTEGEQLVILVRSTTRPADRQVQLVADALELTPNIAQVADPITDSDPRLRADDGRSQIIVASLRPRLSKAGTDRAVATVQRIARIGITVTHAEVGGTPLVGREAAAGARRDLLRGEGIALPIALVLLVVLFGGVVAASAPILVAAASVGGTLLVLWPVAQARAISPYAINVVTMFGLALGIDYGLLLLSRFREERHRGHDVAAAVALSQRTAGRTVTFSGLTVMAALLGLPVFGDPLLTSLTIGGIVVVGIAIIAARTLVPAVLLLFGHRVTPRAPASDDGRFARLARGVVRHPWPVALGVTAVLVLSAAPVLHADIVLPDQRVLPASSPSRHVADALAGQYQGRYDPSITVVATATTLDPGWRASLAALPGVTGVVSQTGYGADVQVLAVHVRGTGQDHLAQDVVRDIRRDASRRLFGVHVAGQAAELIDYRRVLGARLLPAVGIVIATMVLLLFAMTGSVVVPIKAVLVGLLSLTSTAGVMVWGFQDGHLGAPTGGLSAEVPLVIFVFAFGLSLDYETFLLGRVREVWLETGNSDQAVIVALQRTGGVITSAAALVTVVRCLLVPAVMALLGRRNWWAPAPLAWLHARLAASTLNDR